MNKITGHFTNFNFKPGQKWIGCDEYAYTFFTVAEVDNEKVTLINSRGLEEFKKVFTSDYILDEVSAVKQTLERYE